MVKLIKDALHDVRMTTEMFGGSSGTHLAGLRSAQSCTPVPLKRACATGRHPLTELVTDTYIPNDTKMSAQTGRVQVPACPLTACKCSLRAS